MVIAQRSSNAFLQHEDGDALQRALLTGIYDGDYFPEMKGKKVSQSWIARQLGVSNAAISIHKKKLLENEGEVKQIIEHEQKRIKQQIVKRVVNVDDLPNLTEEISIYHRLMIQKAANFVEQIERDYEKSNDPTWRRLWLEAMKETRNAIGDAIKLFGLVDDEVANVLMVQMHHKVERTIEFMQEFAPELLTKYVAWLDSD